MNLQKIVDKTKFSINDVEENKIVNKILTIIPKLFNLTGPTGAYGGINGDTGYTGFTGYTGHTGYT